jgi:FKBP-type peptidyl-prolyl cis-trans isomerase (trigger factor)
LDKSNLVTIELKSASMTSEIEKLAKSTFRIKVTIPADKVAEAEDKVLTEVAKHAEVSGFRKGNAPKELVREKLDQAKFRGEVLNELLKTYYPQIVKEHNITVIANPKVEINQFETGKTLIFTATVAARPEVKLGDFRKQIKTTFETKLEEAKKKEPEKKPHVHLYPHEIIDAIVGVTDTELPDMAIEEETDRMMSRLVDQLQAAGLSMEKYLSSNNKTAQELRQDYTVGAEKALKTELGVSEVVKTEQLEVSDEDIMEMAKAAGDDKIEERMKDAVEKAYIKSILSKNKLIQKLIEEVDEPHEHEEDKNDPDHKSEE